MNWICESCNAKHFKFELTSDKKCQNCYQKGKLIYLIIYLILNVWKNQLREIEVKVDILMKILDNTALTMMHYLAED